MQKCFRFGAHKSGRISCSLCHDVLINALLLMYYWIFSNKEPVLYVVYVYIMTINVSELKKIEKNFVSYRSESPGQVMLFILSWLYLVLQQLPKESWTRLWLAYDNMCSLVKLRLSQAPLPLPSPYNMMWLKLNKCIDSLHLRNHTEKFCQTDLNPALIGQMHPDIKESKNTQAAEQVFIWLGRFKKIVCSMTKTHHLFFLHRMVRRRNCYTSQCYKDGRKPVLPGVKIRWSCLLQCWQLFCI